MGAKIIAVGVLAGVTVLMATLEGKTAFLVGGALINAGYSIQDGQKAFDFEHLEGITPDEVWTELAEQNRLASSVRSRFPRTDRHPLVAMLVCMDARIDTNELAGDSRRNYYVVRTAGSVMSPEEEDMLELAVVNGVKVLVLTRHTDCAAEKVAADPAQRARFPALAASIDERDARLREFLARPAIAERIASGELIVKQQLIETANDHLIDRRTHSASGAGL
jgi:carbonic anhydrase